MKQAQGDQRKSATRMDLLLILILLAVSGCLLLLRQRQEAGFVVRILLDNEVQAVLPLDRDDSYTVTTELGTNTVIIENGQAYMTDADCPDKICEQMGRISKPGETIICLPHKIIVEVNDEP